MGEKITIPNDNKQNGESNQEQDHSEEEMEQDDEESEEDISPEEFERINNQLDELNTALDDMEQKNDSIYAQLLQLRQANREIRRELNPPASSNPTNTDTENKS